MISLRALRLVAAEIARRDAVELVQSDETKAMIAELQRARFLTFR